MKCIVPIAGPDVWSDAYQLRPLVDVGGQPLLEAALRPRAWASGLTSSDYVFVVRDTTGLGELTNYLTSNWPGCRIVTLSHLTQGALFSCLAAMAMVSPDEPIIIDLADILFSEGPQHPRALFESDGYGAIVPSFSSDESCFSYLKITAGLVIEAREKQVISSHASAGVYMFATSGIFLTAAAHSIAHRDSLAVNNNLFICPMINGVIAAGHTVIAPNITDYHPIGKIFHSL